jgi:hypothetical protein
MGLDKGYNEHCWGISFGASDESALYADCVSCQGKADGGDAGVRALARVIRHHAIGTIGLFQKIAKRVALEFVQRDLVHRRLTDHQSTPVIIFAANSNVMAATACGGGLTLR